MDNTKYAFVDEFGAFGYDFSNSGCTTHFIISAIIVDRDNLQIRDRCVPSWNVWHSHGSRTTTTA